jgi:hypothetical protein
MVAETEGSLTGERLKNDGSVSASRQLTETCLARDRVIDGGDGSSSGRVRWVVCLQGPDCEEAGMY